MPQQSRCRAAGIGKTSSPQPSGIKDHFTTHARFENARRKKAGAEKRCGGPSVTREDNGAARLDVFRVADFLPGKFEREAFLRRNAAGTFKLERKTHAGRCNRTEFERLHLRRLKVAAHVRIGAESPFDQKKLRDAGENR